MADISASVELFMSTFNTRDFETMLGFFWENAVYVDPQGCEHKGVAKIAIALAPGFEKSNVDSNFEVTSTIIDPGQSKALVTWTLYRSTVGGEKFAIDGLDILHFQGQKIVLKNAFCKAREFATRPCA